MGKAEDEQPLPSTTLDAQSATPDAGNSNGCCLGCSRLRKVVTLRCIFVLVLGVAGFLSAVFWLPFFHFGGQKDLDLDYPGHDIVARFTIPKPPSSIENYVIQLEKDIFDEISFPTTKVEVLSVVSAGPNTTSIVFAVESGVTTCSLIRASFVSLVTHVSYLHLTQSLFGDPSSFDVLKFEGGITASPDQKAFTMQKVQILFNFTLNFSIDQILYNFKELTTQLKSGLRLAPYENLYISLTNLKGSTVDPPTTVETKVLLAVGNPSKSRMKQLARTITDPHSKNLGLNNTVFGRVKQVQLSSMSNITDTSSPSPSPSPTPLPPPSHQHHHHHHHHHEPSHTPTVSPSPSMGRNGPPTAKVSPVPAPVPAPAPAPAPTPAKSPVANPPGCHFGYKNRFPPKRNRRSHITPTPSPAYAPPHIAPSQPPQLSDPTIPHPPPVPAASPVSNIHPPPPPKGDLAGSPSVMPLVSPALSPSSAGTISSNLWALVLCLVLTHLWRQRT